jgi:biotin carboxylase
MVNDYECLARAFDKGRVYDLLKREVPEVAPGFQIVNNYPDFLKAMRDLGYPDQKVVVKPRFGRGGRGVYVLSGKFDYQTVFQSKPSIEFPLEFFREILQSKDKFDELIVMEYLDNPFYSVYSLSKEGENIISLTHIREWGNASQTFRGLVCYDKEIEAFAAKINKLLGLTFTTNLELATTKEGRIALFDLNPRIGASSGTDRFINLNFPYLALKVLLGEDVSVNKNDFTTPGRFVRYFDEIWTHLQSSGF